MRIATITFGRTKNLGDFNSVKCEVTVEVNAHDDHYEAADMAKQFIVEQIRLKTNDILAERARANAHLAGKGETPPFSDPPPPLARRRRKVDPDYQGDEPEAYGGSPT